MHLTIQTHFSIFWVVCHPSKTFPPKEFKWEPQNKLPFLPTARPYSLLSLTHGPPLLYRLGTSWWCLSLMCAPLPCVSKACLQLMRLSWPGSPSMHSAAHSWPLVAWTCFWAFILYDSLSSWVEPCLIVGFSLFNPFFAPSVNLLAFLLCHSIIPVVVLLGLYLLGLFSGLVYAFLFT